MMRRVYFSLVIVCLLCGGILLSCKSGGKDTITPDGTSDSTITDANPPPEDNGLSYVFTGGSEGYSCFRIPAIIKTKNGTLLAFAEARKNSCGDAGDIDMVVRRSMDNGKTWSGLITVWDDGGNTCGNPAPVVDQKTGDIILLMTWNRGEDNLSAIVDGTSKDTRRVFVTRSSDDGTSWATPKEITDSVKQRNWTWYATGPCHGIQINDGKYKGRMIVPCDHREQTTKKGSSHTIYSDDNGLTWHLGGVVDNGGDESSVGELSNGDLLLSMRHSKWRLVSTSKDGGLSWSTGKSDYQLPDPGCQGSLLSYPVGKDRVLFFSNPSNGSTRENMTIKESMDNGGTWPKSIQVYAGPAAYSDLVMIDASHIGVLYEAGQYSPYSGIAFKEISVNEIK